MEDDIATPSVAETIENIRRWHDGQFDWCGEPYWTHPVAVMNALPEGSSDERRRIALLHDVIEDCWRVLLAEAGIPVPDDTGKLSTRVVELCSGYLHELGYTDHVLSGVVLVTRIPGALTYAAMIDSICASGHIDSMVVKHTDNRENTNPARYGRLSEADLKRAHEMAPRYKRSMERLSRELTSRGVAL